MKKTFLTCLAVVALLAIATSAGAITCTIDQRPAATLLIPYFQATFKPDGSICGVGPCDANTPNALDTLVTIGNASSAPMLAHVNVFNDRSELVLDFNIALTGFDIQSFSVASILEGFLPVTPVNHVHVPEVKDSPAGVTPPSYGQPSTQVTANGDVCQRNGGAVYPAPGGFLRIGGTFTSATPLDNTLATVAYPPGPFSQPFLSQVIDSLDGTPDTNTCPGATGPLVGGTNVDGIITNPIHGYITIDHVNYCNLSNPSDPNYYTLDAIGMENNLFGDYIYVSGSGVPTLGFPAVAIEADASLSDTSGSPTDAKTFGSWDPATGPAGTCGPASRSLNCVGRRTFYRRYVINPDAAGCANAFPSPQAGFDCGGGDQREPLGLKYAARWFDGGSVTPNLPITSFFNVWRASAVPSFADPNGLGDLLDSGPPALCDTAEPTVTLTFYDEDENTVSQGVCPSPCKAPKFNFPLETQRTNIKNFSHPAWQAGWVSMEFFNNSAPVKGALDQAYVTYDFDGAAAFFNAGVTAAQLDPSNCLPLQVPVAPAGGGVTPTAPAIPVIVGTGP